MITGVDGGFDVDEKKYEYEDINSVVILPDWTVINLPNADLPLNVRFWEIKGKYFLIMCYKELSYLINIYCKSISVH